MRIGTSSGKILGTSITCFGTSMSTSKNYVGQLFHHLRRRINEKRHQRDCIDNLLHGAPHIQLLRRVAILSGRDPPGSSS